MILSADNRSLLADQMHPVKMDFRLLCGRT